MNNNMNINNPFMFQQNQMMNINAPLFNINPIFPMGQQQNNLNEDEIINVEFKHIYGKVTNLICNSNEKISEVIKKYRVKANDFDDNNFIYNNQRLNDSEKTLKEIRYYDRCPITVSRIGNVIAGVEKKQSNHRNKY